MFLSWMIRILMPIILLVIITVLLIQGIANKRRRRESLNSGKTIMVVKRSTKSKIMIITMNSLLLAVFIVSAWCYQDMFQLAANGGDPLGLLFLYIVSVPSLLVLALVLACFKNRLQIPLFDVLITLVGIPALIIPLMVNGTDQSITQHIYWIRVGLAGVGMGAALSIATVATTVAILKPKKSKSELSS